MQVLDKIRSGKYRSVMPKFEKVPINPDNMTVTQAKVHEQLETVRFRQHRSDCLKDEHRLRNEFQADLEKDYGMTGHPKAAAVFSKAWDDGHSEGYERVLFEYAELVELVL